MSSLFENNWGIVDVQLTSSLILSMPHLPWLPSPQFLFPFRRQMCSAGSKFHLPLLTQICWVSLQTPWSDIQDLSNIYPQLPFLPPSPAISRYTPSSFRLNSRYIQGQWPRLASKVAPGAGMVYSLPVPFREELCAWAAHVNCPQPGIVSIFISE